MDDDTQSLFHRVADKLGWSEKGGLKTAEEQLIKNIGKTRCPAVGSHRISGAKNLHCPPQLHLLDSEEENDECSEKENRVRQVSQGNTYRTTMLIESSDDDFDQFLAEQATPKAAPRKTCSAVKKVSEPVLVLSSDSDGSFEDFLSRVRTPKPKPKKVDSGSEDSLKNFIVNSFSSDDDFVMEKKKTLTSKGSSKTPKPSSSQPLIRKPLSLNDSPVFLSDSDGGNDIAVKSTWRTRHTKRQPAPCEVEVQWNNPNDGNFPSCPSPPPPPAAYLSSSPPVLASSFAPTPLRAPPQRTHSAPSMLEDSASSEEEFLTLLERIKRTPKTCLTPTPTQNIGPIQKPPPSAQRTKAPKEAGPWPVGRTPLDLKTPVRLPVTKPKVSQTEPRLQTGRLPSSRALATVCKTPGCFLQSLSGPDSNYNRNFKQTREELTSRLFRLYNASVFDGKLPGNMSVSWNKKMRKTAGHCITGQERGGNRYARIELSEKVCDSADRLRDTLVHEMCHAATWLINSVRDGHGPFWKLYARKATLAHPELPMVTRCHSYDINYKYQYRCSCCDNIIGRHSKSLDTQRFVCALCTGPLVLLTPAKPRAPTPFATFVKENYGNVRQELVGQSHGEVMRKLSADFATKTKLV